jgi:hypothetical protein
MYQIYRIVSGPTNLLRYDGSRAIEGGSVIDCLHSPSCDDLKNPWFDDVFQCDEERLVPSPRNLTSFRDVLAVPSNARLVENGRPSQIRVSFCVVSHTNDFSELGRSGTDALEARRRWSLLACHFGLRASRCTKLWWLQRSICARVLA